MSNRKSQLRAKSLSYTPPHPLLIDPMQPHLLLRSRAKTAHPQHLLHLLDAQPQYLPRDEEADALPARRARQAAAVRPELVEVEDSGEQHVVVERGAGHGGFVGEGEVGGELGEEGGRGVARVEADGEDGGFETGGVDLGSISGAEGMRWI